MDKRNIKIQRLLNVQFTYKSHSFEICKVIVNDKTKYISLEIGVDAIYVANDNALKIIKYTPLYQLRASNTIEGCKRLSMHEIDKSLGLTTDDDFMKILIKEQNPELTDTQIESIINDVRKSVKEEHNNVDCNQTK